MKANIDFLNKKDGFTLAEILMAVAITGIVMAGIAISFQAQTKTSTVQDQTLMMQQGTRVAMELIMNELRMAAFDPTDTDGFGITNISLDANGNSSITFTADIDEDGVLAATGETFTYLLYDFSDSTPALDIVSSDLGRDVGFGSEMLIENIEAFSLAYAYDIDNDGELDTYACDPGSGVVQSTIWAIDNNNDGDWDNLDFDNDCDIDENDGATVETGSAINLADIRVVHIWILARSKTQDISFIDPTTYIVGQQLITGSAIPDEVTNGGYRRQLLESTVELRNMGLK